MLRDMESFPSWKQKEVVDQVRQIAHPLQTAQDLDPLLKRIGDARIVMLGEASHGTHEYYTWRAQITRRLIQEKNFNFIAVEGDWPDCYSINRYIKQYTTHQSAKEVLNNFNRWPTWMWANWEIAALTDWLYKHNEPLPKEKKVGFYGLDVYSLWDSMQAIKEYLQKVDPAALQVAEEAFSCFDPYKKDDGQSYAYASRLVPELCESEVVALLKEIQRKMPLHDSDHEMAFSTEQNALVAVNAEKYYRAMMQGGASSWNVRDSHMFETLQRLLDFHGPDSKVIVWEHNTHIGDSRYTDMADDGMYNIGELVRDHYNKEDVVLVGFGSYFGTVIAANKWGSTMRKMKVPKGRHGSWEDLLQQAGEENKLLLLDELTHHAMYEERIAHRAIGVVYNPEYEMYGNYVPSIIPLRYDAFLYLHQTTALHPLHIEAKGGEMPDTYPFGM
ncbi:erythromycin esterase family protein [Aridibaculum aurantiacum]|uniref:erythromycin esterase family protein n=1 Tax=Aridibaculum aurantiacum TaxID=2810307 RepID=UPI001A96C3B8|nr:erythromycin esterase family protein [Aridibaculum aurantiacum]